MDISLLDINSIDREEGEGMEMTETESVLSTNSQVTSLEQLLSFPETKSGWLLGVWNNINMVLV